MASNNNNNVDTSVQISTQSDRKSLPFDSQSNVNAMVTIKAPQYSASSRAPLDLVTVLDRSGSMGGEKMDLLKKTMKCVIQELSAKDRLSIVTFDNMLETNLSLRFMDEQGKAAALRAMDSVNARGGTNLCAGVCEGMKVMRERKEKSEVTSIWVLTDGLTNEGLTRKEDIIKAMHNPEFQLNLGRPILSNVGYMPMQFMQQQQQPFPQQQIPQLPSPQLPILQLPIPPTPNSYNNNNLQTGLPPKAKIMLEEDEKEKNKSNNNNNEKPELPLPGTLHTFGFGSDHDSNMLKALAEHGNGMYYFIKDANKISETFADCLGGLLSTTSQNIELTLEPMNGVTITNVMGKYKKEEEGARVKLFLGDLQSDERRDIVFSLDIPSVPERFAEFNVLKANLKYQDVIQNVPKLASIELKLKRPDVAEPETPNIELDRNLNRLKSADAMSYSADLAAKGKMDQAREVINKCIRAIQESVSKSDPFCVSLLSDLQTTLSGLKDSVTFQNYGQQAMHTNVMSHYAQRQAGPQASYSSAQQAYTTTNRSVVTSHFH